MHCKYKILLYKTVLWVVNMASKSHVWHILQNLRLRIWKDSLLDKKNDKKRNNSGQTIGFKFEEVFILFWE